MGAARAGGASRIIRIAAYARLTAGARRAFLHWGVAHAPGDTVSHRRWIRYRHEGAELGVGSMKPGSLVEVEIEGIGRLANRFG